MCRATRPHPLTGSVGESSSPSIVPPSRWRAVVCPAPLPHGGGVGVEGGGVEAISPCPPRDELCMLHSGVALGLGGSLAVPTGLPPQGGGRVPACSAGVRRGGVLRGRQVGRHRNACLAHVAVCPRVRGGDTQMMMMNTIFMGR